MPRKPSGAPLWNRPASGGLRTFADSSPAARFGRPCAPAGAFLTIRSLLAEAGARAAEIAPSTPLAAYTRRFSGVFILAATQLAPGALPTVRIRTPVYDAAIWGLPLALLCLVAGPCTGLPWLTIFGVLSFATIYAFIWFAARCLLPASVEFGELRTFRDLARAMTEQQCRQQ
jgi:hypothetical protein